MKCCGRKDKGFTSRALPFIMNIMFTLLGIYFLSLYHTAVSSKDNLYFGYVMYTTYLLNAIAGLTSCCGGNDDSYCDLRVLLDYAQLSLVLPSYATTIWGIRGMGAQELAVLPALFGIAALLFFVLMEYKRQDLTDLAMIISGITLLVTGVSAPDYTSFVMAVIYLVGYFFFKRREACCLGPPGGFFQYMLIVYNFGTLWAMGPQSWLPKLKAEE